MSAQNAGTTRTWALKSDTWRTIEQDTWARRDVVKARWIDQRAATKGSGDVGHVGFIWVVVMH